MPALISLLPRLCTHDSLTQETLKNKLKALKWCANEFGHASREETEGWGECANNIAGYSQELSKRRHEYVLFVSPSSSFNLA